MPPHHRLSRSARTTGPRRETGRCRARLKEYRDCGNEIPLRFQRGVMMYDASSHATQGMLLADYFKDILTGTHVPPDLAS